MPSNRVSQSGVLDAPEIAVVGSVFKSLCQASASGQVLMRFERCAYLQFNTQLICIGLRELGASSLTGLLADHIQALPESLSVGAAVRLTHNALWISEQDCFSLFNAIEYTSSIKKVLPKLVTPTVPGERCPELMQLSNGVVREEFLAKLSYPEVGLAPLLKESLHSDKAETTLTVFLRPFIEQLLLQVQNQCNKQSVEPSNRPFAVNAFDKLLGAGPGLTPSGDDFICGVFAALYLTQNSHTAWNLWQSIRTQVEHSTTVVSGALLAQSAQGESSERLDSLMHGYLTFPNTKVAEIEFMLSQIGETSGWDWFTGFVMCLRSLAHKKHLGRLQSA